MQDVSQDRRSLLPSGQHLHGMPRNRSYTAELLAFTLGSVLLLVGMNVDTFL